MVSDYIDKLREQRNDGDIGYTVLTNERYDALVEVVALAEKLQECIDWCEKEDEPVSGYVCERNDPLRAALTKLAEQVAAAVRGDPGGK